jgi:hypothetical protein
MKLAPVVALALTAGACMSIRPGAASAQTWATPVQYTANFAGVINTDVTSSVALPDGTELYLGGDVTEVNGVSTVGYYGYPHDAFITEPVAGSASFTVVRGHYGTDYVNGVATPGAQWQQVPNFSNGDYMWFSGGLVDGATLYVYGEEVQGLDTVEGEAMAEFNATTLAYEGTTVWTSGAGDASTWSASVPVSGGHYLVGMNSATCVDATDCTGDVAFVPTGDELNPSAWSVATSVFPSSAGLGNQVSVVTAPGGGYLAYAKGCDVCGDGSLIKELSAPGLTGPWTPTGRTWATSAPAGAITYSVQAHPEDSAPGTLLISYAVNGGGQYYPNFFATTALPFVVPGRSPAPASALGAGLRSSNP